MLFWRYFVVPLPQNNNCLNTFFQSYKGRHACHCWRNRDELIREVILWTTAHGHTSFCWPANAYIHQLCADSGCSLENLLWEPGRMDGMCMCMCAYMCVCVCVRERERERERERVNGIYALSLLYDKMMIMNICCFFHSLWFTKSLATCKHSA